MKGLIEITNDLFDISSRLKEIDRNYRLYYNKIKSRYEVYAKGALQFVAPFEKLDVRTLNHARKTRIENAERLFAEIKNTNFALEQNADNDAICKMLNATEGSYVC